MKWLNPGIAELFEVTNKLSTEKSSEIPTGFYLVFDGHSRSAYKTISASEFWFSYDFKLIKLWFGRGVIVPLSIKDSSGTTVLRVAPVMIDNLTYLGVYNATGNLLYTSDKTYLSALDNAWHNIEFHVKTGENGRIDIWLDTKLFCSFRSPSAFNFGIQKVGIATWNGGDDYISAYQMSTSSFILQDTRRIGLEKFKKLTINPDAEQNMPQGSTTTYTLSGLSDATEFSDITSFCAVLQATSRDANISTGTFSLEGADVGTIDVSDSSGKAYEIAYAETNSMTGKPWTRDDIEGKTLSFKVNGAS